MEADRADGVLSVGGSPVVAALDGSTTLAIAGISAFLLLAAAAGGLFVFRRQEGDEAINGEQRGSTGDNTGESDSRELSTASDAHSPNGENDGPVDTAAGNAAAMSTASFDEQIGTRTLDRLEPIVGTAVRDTRDRLPRGHDASPAMLDRIERELRTGVKDAIGEGRFDPSVTSPLGGVYDVVNLPGQYRELVLPSSGETVHVAEFERVAREALDQQHLRDAVRSVAAIHEHCRDVESYIRRHEEPYLTDRADIEKTLSDTGEIVGRFDGPLGERLTDLVVDGRHETLDGVVDIERRLDAADLSLHRCAFDDAMRTLHDARDAADDLLMVVDFLGGVTGTIDHGSGRVTVPDDVPIDVVEELVPLFGRQYDIDIEIDNQELIVTDCGAARTPHETDRSGPSTDERLDETLSTREIDRPTQHSSAETQSSHEQFTPDAVADEILFILREFDPQGDGDVVECQTERLPDAVARPAVLEPLTTFCRRQTDLVETVTLQAGAPPGFLEIEFREGTSVSSGLNALRDRFVERHGS